MQADGENSFLFRGASWFMQYRLSSYHCLEGEQELCIIIDLGLNEYTSLSAALSTIVNKSGIISTDKHEKSLSKQESNT